MPTGINATIVSLTNGTTANAPDVMSSLNSLNTNGVSNDGGNITTDGSGNMTVKSASFTHGRLTQFTVFTGVGPQTGIAHGGSVAPVAIFVNYFAAGGNFGIAPTQIPYAWNVGPTTCNIVAQNSYTWVAIAIVN